MVCDNDNCVAKCEGFNTLTGCKFYDTEGKVFHKKPSEN